MPQLIAMIIVVVGALIYMFQTFGGTGDKIEGIAQKTSVLTEINNIKDGVKLAARTGMIGSGGVNDPADAVSTLKGLGTLSFFAEQINEQVKANTVTGTNAYNAISFGGNATNNTTPDMVLSLAVEQNMIPGIFVDLSKGTLSDNAGFFETQISNDLSAIAFIDRHATAALQPGNDTAPTAQGTTAGTVELRLPVATAAGTDTDKDGKFIIYFKDFGSNEVVR